MLHVPCDKKNKKSDQKTSEEKLSEFAWLESHVPAVTRLRDEALILQRFTKTVLIL